MTAYLLPLIALILLLTVFLVNRRLFADDRFARAILWVIALPISVYLVYIASLR